MKVKRHTLNCANREHDEGKPAGNCWRNVSGSAGGTDFRSTKEVAKGDPVVGMTRAQARQLAKPAGASTSHCDMKRVRSCQKATPLICGFY